MQFCLANEISNGVESHLRHINPEHVRAWLQAMGSARKKYYDDVYGEKKIELAILGTHPEHRNHGAATKLIRWGLEFADEHEKAIAVVGSSMGSKLYKSLGFKFVGTVPYSDRRRGGG